MRSIESESPYTLSPLVVIYLISTLIIILYPNVIHENQCFLQSWFGHFTRMPLWSACATAV